MRHVGMDSRDRLNRTSWIPLQVRVVAVALAFISALAALCSCTQQVEPVNLQNETGPSTASAVSVSIGAENEVTSAGMAQSSSASGAEQIASGNSFATPYYRIELPESWGDATFQSNEEMVVVEEAPLYARAYYTEVILKEGRFRVACFSDAASWQADVVSKDLGMPTEMPGWYVSVAVSRSSDLASRIDELASFVAVL